MSFDGELLAGALFGYFALCFFSLVRPSVFPVSPCLLLSLAARSFRKGFHARLGNLQRQRNDFEFVNKEILRRTNNCNVIIRSHGLDHGPCSPVYIQLSEYNAAEIAFVNSWPTLFCSRFSMVDPLAINLQRNVDILEQIIRENKSKYEVLLEKLAHVIDFRRKLNEEVLKNSRVEAERRLANSFVRGLVAPVRHDLLMPWSSSSVFLLSRLPVLSPVAPTRREPLPELPLPELPLHAAARVSGWGEQSLVAPTCFGEQWSASLAAPHDGRPTPCLSQTVSALPLALPLAPEAVDREVEMVDADWSIEEENLVKCSPSVEIGMEAVPTLQMVELAAAAPAPANPVLSNTVDTPITARAVPQLRPFFKNFGSSVKPSFSRPMPTWDDIKAVLPVLSPRAVRSGPVVSSVPASTSAPEAHATVVEQPSPRRTPSSEVVLPSQGVVVVEVAEKENISGPTSGTGLVPVTPAPPSSVASAGVQPVPASPSRPWRGIFDGPRKSGLEKSQAKSIAAFPSSSAPAPASPEAGPSKRQPLALPPISPTISTLRTEEASRLVDTVSDRLHTEELSLDQREEVTTSNGLVLVVLPEKPLDEALESIVVEPAAPAVPASEPSAPVAGPSTARPMLVPKGLKRRLAASAAQVVPRPEEEAASQQGSARAAPAELQTLASASSSLPVPNQTIATAVVAPTAPATPSSSTPTAPAKASTSQQKPVDIITHEDFVGADVRSFCHGVINRVPVAVQTQKEFSHVNIHEHDVFGWGAFAKRQISNDLIMSQENFEEQLLTHDEAEELVRKFTVRVISAFPNLDYDDKFALLELQRQDIHADDGLYLNEMKPGVSS
ncbi:hypothetical protein B0T26DRAFT_673209 [Lasiosphaeria miniovina]|uniref:Uncharacterized protein n=1 Tax=Lasiosphaeria miniovina TaxID=1954250 RepID=A0AA40B6S1_9PEZI|nr:uncharacterized protein B0T26DRAFT_673209 [Lasiosphaeria miniovina]KAK0728726.1 hypothetical protein B0T26DRAFT_673209 [Lasiosphaeria miniovina]